MFNQEIKERYFSQLPENRNNIVKRRHLERMASSEESLGIDICQMSRVQAIKTVEETGAYDLSSFDNIISSGKAYVRWCIDEGLFPESPYGFLGISSTDINPDMAIRNQFFLTEREMVDAIRKYVPIYEGYPEVIACLFAWIGIPSPLEIHDQDVRIEERKIYCNGKEIVDGFSDFVAEFLESYKNLKMSTRENGTTVYNVVKDRSYDNFIKRFCSPSSNKLGRPMDIRVIQTAINELNKKYEEDGNPPRITYRNILKAGSLHRLYNAERNGLDIYNKKNREIVEGFFSQTGYRSIIYLYEHYKTAFSL